MIEKGEVLIRAPDERGVVVIFEMLSTPTNSFFTMSLCKLAPYFVARS